MTEPEAPGAPEPTAPELMLTGDLVHASIADAVSAAEAPNGQGPAVQFDGEFDAERASALIAKLRKESAALKGSATKAAQSARDELAQAIGKAIGLVQDDQPVDPAKLTEQLTASTAATKQAQVELAVYRAAGAVNADPSALLDSRNFMDKVAALEPGDTAGITAAIAAAVAANPRLAPPPAGVMRPNPAQGSSASPPLGVNEQIAAAEKAGDLKAVIRLKSSKALAPK